MAVAGLLAPAHAAGVNVRVRISAGGYAGVVKDCPAFAVPAGSDGVVVLNAARSHGCIAGFKTVQYSFGTFVTCIDPGQAEICQGTNGVDSLTDGLVTFWEYYKNGQSQSVGIDKFNAAAGDEIAFAYTASVLCFTPSGCAL